jgi:hypothetical protein
MKNWPDSDSESLNSSEMIAFSIRNNMEILFPEPRQLFLDIRNCYLRLLAPGISQT